MNKGRAATTIMAGKKAATENTKKASGNAKKAEAAQKKAAVENEKKAAAEDDDWGKGAKSTAKKYGISFSSDGSLGRLHIQS